MSFWSDLGKLQPGRFIRRNIGDAFEDAFGSVATFLGNAAKDIGKNRVFRAVTLPQRVLAGAGASLIAPKETQRVLGLSDRELAASVQIGQVAGVAGTAILAPVAAPFVQRVLFDKKPPPPIARAAIGAAGGTPVLIPDIGSPPIFPDTRNDSLRDLFDNWGRSSAPTSGPEQAAAQPAVVNVTLAPQDPESPAQALAPDWSVLAWAGGALVLVILIVGLSRA